MNTANNIQNSHYLICVSNFVETVLYYNENNMKIVLCDFNPLNPELNPICYLFAGIIRSSPFSPR